MRKRKMLLLLLATVLIFSGCAEMAPAQEVPVSAGWESLEADAGPAGDSKLEIHVLDVGQGDSILLVCEGEAMLIDAGANSAASRVVTYLEDAGIRELKYVVGTHPHEDHIGGLDEVILAFDVQNVLMPEILHTTNAFVDVLDALEEKELQVTAPAPGDTFPLGSATLTSLNPITNEKDLNNSSIVLRLEFQNRTALFMGDAEEKAEKAILETGLPVKSEILKAGHHGSKTSSSWAFLEAVAPRIAILSCGTGNTYGHPHEETVSAMESLGVQVFRTDLLGNILITASADGYHMQPEYDPAAQRELIMPDFASQSETEPAPDVSVDDLPVSDGAWEAAAEDMPETAAESEPVPDLDTAPQNIYFVTATGQAYHLDGCSYLSSSKLEITLEEAIAQEYRPCSRCLKGE